ncbi:hypothetical protein LCL89_10825 [Halobacillus yeomjeoni]|uniref:Uncharacterized protein n=1 Tax=Halobacillus yeomjeoni TaxID=311194 RepID=A0A931HWR5_9BACI|nr:hypothetical protein [Halobacillus yeomjeoni]MBH0231019.1 hypothetical protein [Halobacillus yeomjeoni]MCA0984537.1 hypothetical protein [Halobacillus yeomjeoni]
MNYTAEMEKAMHQAHNMGYAEYSRNIDNRLKIEVKRQREFEQCKQMLSQVGPQLHR